MLNAASQEVLCRWAEERYGLSDVESVQFEVEEGYGGGCDTCGYGSSPPYVEVNILAGENSRYYKEESYAPDLINSIVEVAIRGN